MREKITGHITLVLYHESFNRILKENRLSVQWGNRVNKYSFLEAHNLPDAQGFISGPLLKEQNTGRPQYWTYNRRVWLDKNDDGESKNIAATRREKKNTITSSQKVYGLVPWSITSASRTAVSKSYSASRCKASGTWWCASLASSGCRVISVSADCQRSHLNILESCAVAVRGKERDSGRGGRWVSHN